MKRKVMNRDRVRFFMPCLFVGFGEVRPSGQEVHLLVFSPVLVPRPGKFPASGFALPTFNLAAAWDICMVFIPGSAKKHQTRRRRMSPGSDFVPMEKDIRRGRLVGWDYKHCDT